MATTAQYETKPLDCWPKLQELRRKYTRDLWTAKDRGEFLMVGVASCPQGIPAGLGTVHYYGGLGPNFGQLMDNHDLLIKCLEAAERVGFGRSTCSTLRATLGSMYLGVFDKARSGETVRGDFAFEVVVCQNMGKTGQVLSEYYDVPYFSLEMPTSPEKADYLILQMHDAIDWLQKVTGKEYQDDLLIEAVKNEWQARVLWSKICELQKAVPAPVDQKILYAFNALNWRGGLWRPEVVDFYQMALDEIQDRVAKQIAILGTERCRLLHEGPATWYDSPVLRYPKAYGAVYIGAYQVFQYGAWVADENGSWVVGPTLEEAGLELNNREDAVAAMAKLALEYCPMPRCSLALGERVKSRVSIAEDWNTDGVVFGADRGCIGATSAHLETILALKDREIPTLIYEGSLTNPSEFDEVGYKSLMDVFLESLGLEKDPAYVDRAKVKG